MNDERIRDIEEYVSKRFEEADLNFCGFVWYFKEHIEPVKKIAERLAVKYGADLTAVRLAALLHDMGLIGEGPDGHEKRSTQIAEAVLREKGFDEQTISRVKSCILHDRSTIEGKVLDAADALSHFRPQFLFYRAKLSRSYEEFKKYVLEKLERDERRIEFPEERKYAESRFGMIKKLL